MAIYTCFDMSRDCVADKPEGYAYFVENYLRVARQFWQHYGGKPGGFEPFVKSLRPAPKDLFRPVPEREFLAALRQYVVGQLQWVPPAAAGDAADLTPTEKQIAWFAALGYDAAATSRLMNADPATVEKVQRKVPGLPAVSEPTPECLRVKSFLDAIDGRVTWSERQDIDRHLEGCWYCVDHYCRIREADDALHYAPDLTADEVAHYRTVLRVPEPKRSLFQRMFR